MMFATRLLPPPICICRRPTKCCLSPKPSLPTKPALTLHRKACGRRLRRSDRVSGSAPESVRVLVDPARTSGAVMDILGSRAVATAVSPAAVMKSVKNDVQIAGVRDAMVRDGVALVKAFMEIERRMADGEATTELDVAALLHEYRSQGDLYFDESFGTIAGYAAHGAIVHYEADAASNAQLQPRGLLLVDSGAQYLDGTTI